MAGVGAYTPTAAGTGAFGRPPGVRGGTDMRGSQTELAGLTGRASASGCRHGTRKSPAECVEFVEFEAICRLGGPPAAAFGKSPGRAGPPISAHAPDAVKSARSWPLWGGDAIFGSRPTHFNHGRGPVLRRIKVRLSPVFYKMIFAYGRDRSRLSPARLAGLLEVSGARPTSKFAQQHAPPNSELRRRDARRIALPGG